MPTIVEKSHRTVQILLAVYWYNMVHTVVLCSLYCDRGVFGSDVIGSLSSFYWSKKNLNMSREIVASKPCIDLKSYRKIYSSVDNLYAWLYNETKEKNCMSDEALCHIGYNKLNEGFWCGEGRKWF